MDVIASPDGKFQYVAEATAHRHIKLPVSAAVLTWDLLNDGRAATMEEVLTRFNNEDRHGQTLQLTPREVADLAEFVLSQ